MASSSKTPASLKEYLKKYQSNPEEEKKKKKKKKKDIPAAPGVLVVDEDPVWQKPVIEEEEDSEEEEKPQVNEDIEVKRLKRLEQLRSRRPFGAISEDGSGWVSVSEIPKNVKSGDQNSDISPPRRRRARNDTPSPRPEHESSVGPGAKTVGSGDQISDISPPHRRRARNDTLSPRAEQESVTAAGADLSPPRHRNKRYQSLPTHSEERSLSSSGRRARYDTPSPERLEVAKSSKEVSDLSPPRRRQRASSGPGSKSSLSAATDSDISPPRRHHRPATHYVSAVTDLSPPRKMKETSVSTDVSVRQLRQHMDDDPADLAPSNFDLSPPRKKHKDSPPLALRSKSGLVTGRDIKEEIEKKKEADWLRFEEMDPSVSGRKAEPVYRNKITGERMSKEEFLQSQKEKKKEEKPKEIKLEWGKGLAQKREAEARIQELEMEKEKPFARTRDDADLDSMLKERIRWGDPMVHLVKKKHIEPVLPDLGDDERMKESGFIVPQEIPSHSWIKRGLDAAPNRYGIRPGRHWDGVDRSNGFEKEMFKRMNEKRATEREAYLWSVSDM